MVLIDLEKILFGRSHLYCVAVVGDRLNLVVVKVPGSIQTVDAKHRMIPVMIPCDQTKAPTLIICSPKQQGLINTVNTSVCMKEKFHTGQVRASLRCVD